MGEKFDAIIIGTGQSGPSLAQRLTGAGMEVHDKIQGSYAPKVMLGMKEVAGFRRNDLERAMKRLISDGRIKLEIVGPGSRQRRKFVRVDALHSPLLSH